MKPLPILYIVNAGHPSLDGQSDRFVIEDEKGRKWTGRRFTTIHPEEALLFAGYVAAAREVQRVLKSNFKGVEPKRYMVPMMVEVYSVEPVDPTLIVHYLTQSVSVHVNTAKYGNGPNESLVLSAVHWEGFVPAVLPDEETDEEISNEDCNHLPSV
jgi:hypothetical protein